MVVKEGVLRDILRLFVWFPFRWLIGILPIDLGFYLFRLMGDFYFYIGRGKKKIISENIRHLLNTDNSTVRNMVRRNFENHYLDRLHIFLYPRLNTREKIEKYVYFENIELLDEELKRGKGVLLVQSHFGPVQITLLALALYGYRPIQIGYPSERGLSWIGRRVAYKYRLKYEGMLPAPIILADRYLGKVYKCLLNNGVVLTTGDGAGGGVYLGEHQELNFINTRKLFPLGPAALSLSTGASFIPTFIITEKFNRFRIIFEQPIRPRYSNTEEDKLYITQYFRTVAERYIKEFPYSWHFWDEVGS